MYDRTTARWMSKDPIGFAGSQWNLYEYVGGRPTFALDPSGNECVLMNVGRVGPWSDPTASAGQISIGTGTSPSPVGGTIAQQVVCCRSRTATFAYHCLCEDCSPQDFITSRSTSQTECWVINFTPGVLVGSITIGIPGVPNPGIGIGFGDIISPIDQTLANRACKQSKPGKTTLTPKHFPPAMLPCP